MQHEVLVSRRLNRFLCDYDKKTFVLLETARFNAANCRSFLFDNPHTIIQMQPDKDLNQFFSQAEIYLKKGFWLAGYFSYEFGYLLEQKLKNCMPKKKSMPLAWLGVFRPPFIINHTKPLLIPRPLKEEGLSFNVSNLRSNISEAEYKKAIKKIKDYLEVGDSYQVNFTFKLECDFKGCPFSLYLNLKKQQPTSFMSFISTGDDYILSFSPELFFRSNKQKISTRPMKGTIARGRFLLEDKEREIWLKRSLKNRAENVMIVDLLRNDLGRIAKKGTVKVKQLFSIEKYLTVFQMTSSIEAILKKSVSFKEQIKALFPCGSVTGAPKIRTMQIIRELEKEPRNIYTGAIGFISPQKETCFNVAIRTIHINKENKMSVGIGGGIVYDSKETKEYKEALLKAKFLIKKQEDFSLIETFCWSKTKRYHFLGLHLNRLKNSCDYFSMPFKVKRIVKKLFYLEKLFDENIIYKVRLLLKEDGEIYMGYAPLEDISPPLKATLSTKKVDYNNYYLYHKTTNRFLYDVEYKNAKKHGFDEILFTNKKGQLTEGTFTNIFIQKNLILYTPALKCGLLPGVLRKYLLINGRAKEAVLYPRDILRAEKVFLGNSVRGLMPAKVSFSLRRPFSYKTLSLLNQGSNLV